MLEEPDVVARGPGGDRCVDVLELLMGSRLIGVFIINVLPLLVRTASQQVVLNPESTTLRNKLVLENGNPILQDVVSDLLVM